MAPRFMRRLVELRKKLNFPLILTSAYRCPEYNARVSSTGSSGPHTTGQAVDIAVYGYRAAKLVGLARKYGFTGVGLKQKGPHVGRFVHLDDLEEADGRPRPWVWTY
jgi:uncharacterized protein YcbK (DUF882 family)